MIWLFLGIFSFLQWYKSDYQYLLFPTTFEGTSRILSTYTWDISNLSLPPSKKFKSMHKTLKINYTYLTQDLPCWLRVAVKQKDTIIIFLKLQCIDNNNYDS